jgi:hypothetical protein
MAYSVKVGKRTMYGLRGNLHMHTTSSDGALTRVELEQVANEVGLDFVIITDHNVFSPGQDGWAGECLVLVGEEVHDVEREPQSSHTLCFGITHDMYDLSTDPQELIDAVAEDGGFTFLAHPFERDAPEFLPEPNISWRDWHVKGFSGIELWNYMSEFKASLRNSAQAVLHAYTPELAIAGPYPETLDKWDELLRSGPVAAFGGSDAHGGTYQMGPLSRTVLPYDYLFRAINTHLLTQEPFSGDLQHDRHMVYRALREGHGFVGYERPSPVSGFTFWARSGNAEATMGESLQIDGTVELRLTTPAPARIRILRNGEIIAQTEGDRLTLVAHHAGVYRAEAYRRFYGKERGWIFANPIYVR